MVAFIFDGNQDVLPPRVETGHRLAEFVVRTLAWVQH
jgi:hypothetical protein